ncbi:MAG: phosphoribosyltransferase family protein [Candidatus Gastranaerophilales bacterium]|nr:phosphoribosyltransferase family protein [Candidatus Gastranaerophilales bacterium]
MYAESDLVKIAKRENNKKRNYLVVNPLQGKHIPVSPQKALQMFSELANHLKEYQGERLLVVGFAETATAIGAQIAVELGVNYIQTTREELPDVEYLFFSEEHSHATEQRLVKDDLDKVMHKIDRIVFAEDEVTTGKTIRNLIAVLEQHYGKRLKFAVASLLNGMPQDAVETFVDHGIGVHYLLKICHDNYPEIADKAIADGAYYQKEVSEEAYTACFDIKGRMDTRRLIDTASYKDACEKFSEEIEKSISLKGCKNILVLGTEEFMFAGLYVGSRLEEKGYTVKFHATARSPIAVGRNSEYPLHERYELASMYEESRKIFVYDIGSYDAVIVMTDAQGSEQERRTGEQTLLHALRKKNKIVYLVRWCEK